LAPSIALSLPGLSQSECRRVARRVVGSFLHQADVAGSVIGDQPIGEDDGGEGGGGGSMTGWEKYRATQGLIGKLPGGGEAGAAGAAGELGEVAELAAL
jgi:hypothetical protein